MLTGYGQEADGRRAKEVGIDHFFIKPVEPQTLRRLPLPPKAAAAGEYETGGF